jgi:DNA modification methylase
MVGTGSALVAAFREGRHSVGIELNPEFAEIARNRVKAENPSLLLGHTGVEVHTGDARMLSSVIAPESIDYCVTSPPYWSMLSNVGSENQKARREKNLPMVYSKDPHDIGNVAEYGEFLELLTSIYNSVASRLKPSGHLTVVVKNVKREHILYPLAWDLTKNLSRKGGYYSFVGTTLWCQDDVSIKPFAVGIYWVSNTLHTYCLHFRRC